MGASAQLRLGEVGAVAEPRAPALARGGRGAGALGVGKAAAGRPIGRRERSIPGPSACVVGEAGVPGFPDRR